MAMKTSTRLDSVIFQLTPTRTRCDLIIVANEIKEKIASGLLNPFLAHLMTAQDQIAKGGYSIVLQPGQDSDTTWFTKGTVERFIRFVSTPEILERVYTLESEILQIKEAISFQQAIEDGMRLGGNHQRKPAKASAGNNPILCATGEEAAFIYKPDADSSVIKESTKEEGNSKYILVHLRKTIGLMFE